MLEEQFSAYKVPRMLLLATCVTVMKGLAVGMLMVVTGAAFVIGKGAV